MHLDPYVAEVEQQLRTAAEAAGDDAAEVASRLLRAVSPTVRLVLLDALSAAAGEITLELSSGSVDLRLRGRDPEFVVVPAQAGPAGEEGEQHARGEDSPGEETAGTDALGVDGTTTRTTLRLPEHLKARAEAEATRRGISLNTWLVRAVSDSLDAGRGTRSTASRSRNKQTYTGWARS